MSTCRIRAVAILLGVLSVSCAGQLPVKSPNIALDKYIVRPGDTVELVAYRYRMHPDELRAINNLSGGSLLSPGLRLSISRPAKIKRKTVAKRANPIIVPKPVIERATQAVQPIVLPSGSRVAKKEEIIETVEFEPKRKKKHVPSPNTRQYHASVNGWVWPTSGSVARSFQPNVVNRQGLDITARAGEEVVAAADGTVVYSGQDLASHGKLVILRHNDNVLSAYSLAKELFVQEDELVRAGDAIASLDDRDNQSSILHFEIRKNGKPVNPLNYLPKR